jgi:hypothetical protein
MSELNTISLSDFTKLADVIWEKAKKSVDTTMRNSGLYKVDSISANTGESREFSEIDVQEYARSKNQGDQAQRAQVQQGFKNAIVLVKSILINGESPEVDNAHEGDKTKKSLRAETKRMDGFLADVIVRTSVITI